MKKVCVVTAARSEYGPLRWVIEELNNDNDLQLQLVVTGSHLSEEQGYTYKQIEADGYKIDYKVDMNLSTESSTMIVQSMGTCSIGIAKCFDQLKPDILLVLGDRYELLPICSAALIMGIPIAHMSGGDITEGAIDNEIRNAVTMMSSLHFPGVKESADRIALMRGIDKDIYNVGEPGLDNFLRLKLMSRCELAIDLQIDKHAKWMLLTFHSETRLSIDENLTIAKNIISSLRDLPNTHVIITKSNADLGGMQLNNYWAEVVRDNPNMFSLYSSLGQLRYLSVMKEVCCVIGNSSSGIIEAPFLGVPVINIGDRQKGRHMCENVISSGVSSKQISDAVMNAEDSTYHVVDSYYGDGNTAKKVLSALKSYIYK